jgi:hypothetical protein
MYEARTPPKVRARRLLALGASVAVAVAVAAVASPKGGAETALGCWFNAGTPYTSGGRIYTKLQLKCDVSKTVLLRGRITKVRNNLPDRTVGSADWWHTAEAGRYYTWYLHNDDVACPGSGTFFAKLTIQTGTYSTVYADRSSNVGLSICG